MKTKRAKWATMTMEQKVKDFIPSLWGQIAPDVDWDCDLDGAVELCLDATRPVSFGYLTHAEYKELCALDSDLVNSWACEALKGYF